MVLKIIVLLYVFCFGAKGVYSLVLDQQTDPNVLQLLVKLEADFNNMKSKMEELEESCTCAAPSHQLTQSFMATLGHTFTCAVNQAVIFDTVKLNQGTGYDNRHGVFRAAKNGTYHFGATFTVAPQTDFRVAFVKNFASNHIGYLFGGVGHSFWQETSTSIVTHLNAGDDVWLSCLSPSTLQGDSDTVNDYHTYHSHFSGFMVAEP
ncbi:uncharacterized protein LOC123553436 [Mercenaria mercenaria]|uniref:uncharacterized protein LOC123553436 n=1 Tax=Mercenaria mercenaria TaxID=6596 RepID=UPI00234EED5C|nr:uncharacterized protein LOC123553436 [Mercenaria mercenaria]